MDIGISGQGAIVTGGGRGLGAAICRLLAAEGAQVAVWDRDPEAAEALVAEIRAAGGRAMTVAGQVESPAEVQAGVDAVLAAFGRIDILVNNAGFSYQGPVTGMTDEQWSAVVGVHMTGAFNMVRAVVPGMQARRYGRIINMSSLAAMGSDNLACYAAVKAGLQGFTRALAVELGGHDITVNAVAPSLIRTDRLKAASVFTRLDELSMRNQAIKRGGEPEDVANAVAFFASARSGFITGDVLYVTGGILQLW